MSAATLLVLNYLVQFAVALMLALALAGFARHYRKHYLRLWSASWLAMAIQMLGAALAVKLSPAFGPQHPVRLLVSVLSLIGGYWQVGLLFFGIREVKTSHSVPKGLVGRVLIALALIGIATALLFAANPMAPAAPFFARVGLRAFASGIVFLYAAVTLWRMWPDQTRWGRRLVAGGYAVYGLQQLHYTGIASYQLVTGTTLEYAIYLGFLDYVALAIVALGAATWLLEEEHEAVTAAVGQIQHLAYHDALTGLPNRLLFLDRLQVALAQARRSAKPLAVLFLDLDRFKDINDTLGHTAGDELLQAAAERLSRISRKGDTVARLGGDEFTLMIRDISREDVVIVAQKILEAIREPYVISGRELHVSTSVGICMHPEDGGDADSLLKNADTAMYRAKEEGRDNYQLYVPTMNLRAQERVDLEAGLRRAITNNELALFYQPILDLETGQVQRVEALVRWQHPTRGLLAPGEFLPIADAAGLTDPMDEWILTTACRQAKVWRARGHRLRVAVNVSARPFQRSDFAARVAKVLAATDLPGQALELEITETIAMANAETSLQALRELKALGIHITIDDFGTGHSSLSYLRKFPLDTLKIDRSFVRDLPTDPNAQAIAAAVIELAHRMRMTVVAEGVETEDQRAFLTAQRCDQLQGFLFNRPAPAEQFEAMLRTTTAGAA